MPNGTDAAGTPGWDVLREDFGRLQGASSHLLPGFGEHSWWDQEGKAALLIIPAKAGCQKHVPVLVPMQNVDPVCQINMCAARVACFGGSLSHCLLHIRKLSAKTLQKIPCVPRRQRVDQDEGLGQAGRQ